ncbi:hypothetical protein [Shewanella waksmanii]
MSIKMNRLFGYDTLKIEAPQNRGELLFVVSNSDTDFESTNVRYF